MQAAKLQLGGKLGQRLSQAQQQDLLANHALLLQATGQKETSAGMVAALQARCTSLCALVWVGWGSVQRGFEQGRTSVPNRSGFRCVWGGGGAAAACHCHSCTTHDLNLSKFSLLWPCWGRLLPS